MGSSCFVRDDPVTVSLFRSGIRFASKPMFRDAFKSKRLLIPVSGYCECHDAPGGKQPHYFTSGWSADHVRGPVVELEKQKDRRISAIVHDGDLEPNKLASVETREQLTRAR
jgi:hypothetical protein